MGSEGVFQNLIRNRRFVLSRFGEGGDFAGQHQTTASEDTRSFTDNNEKLKVLVYSARSCWLFVQKFKNTSNLISYLY